MSESFAGMIRKIAQDSNKGIFACTVVRTNPLQLKFEGDADAIFSKECLVIPAHVSLSKGNTAYLMPYGDNSYFVLGKG